MRRSLCGVPSRECGGAELLLNKRYMKVHATPPEAFKCHVKWLISQGYKQVGTREFCKDNGSVLILTKKCRFGGTLRLGKTVKGGGGKRLTYKKWGQGTNGVGGTIIGI